VVWKSILRLRPKLYCPLRILSVTTSKPLLEDAGSATRSPWPPGVYFLSNIFKTAIVAIDQLPETADTLWLRILGRDKTQERAIREVLALPPNHPRQNGILRLLVSWKVGIDLSEIQDFSGQEALMALSQAFLEWEQQTEERIEREVTQRVEQEVRQEIEQTIALNLLQKNLSLETIAEVTGLTIAQLQALHSQLGQN
jgi:hypothetical protein